MGLYGIEWRGAQTLKSGEPMKTRTAVFTLLMLAAVLSTASLSATTKKMMPATGSGCNPDGNRFNLEPLANAPFLNFEAFVTQANESVAVLPDRAGNSGDLVVGTALDARALDGTFNNFATDAYYVQRDNANCAADFESFVPFVDSVAVMPEVTADPAHDAFFIATIFLPDGETTTIGIAGTRAATLLNSAQCPNGTQANPGTCWTSAGLANMSNPNAFLLSDQAISVDQRTKGKASGDVYVAASQESSGPLNQIVLAACTNSSLNCSPSVVISGADGNADYPTVQVRADGGITVSYANFISSSQIQFKFVSCSPSGAPNPPICSAPVLVTTEDNPGSGVPGDYPLQNPDYPRHVDRLESDGKTVTTFLVYDQCAVPKDGFICPKSQVALTSSTDGGNTWSPLQVVGSAAGQQFLGNLALDVSTGTVNIAYYSSQKDKSFKLETQIYLAQVLPGQTSAEKPRQITSALYYGPLNLHSVPSIGVAAGGTGTPGQSVVYIHFTGSTTEGTFNGQEFPIIHNLLTKFEY